MASIIEIVTKARQAVLLGAAFGILVLIAASLVWLITQVTSDAQRVRHTLTVQDKLANVLLSARRAEAGQRGYLLTDQPSYLDDYRAAAPEAPALIAELTQLTSDNPQRQAQLKKIGDLLRFKFDEMARTIELTARDSARLPAIL
jgi:CHASE3 domain sensor protein